MKSETLREFFVSSLFSSCVFGLMLQFMVIQKDLGSSNGGSDSLLEAEEAENQFQPREDFGNQE